MTYLRERSGKSARLASKDFDHAAVNTLPEAPTEAPAEEAPAETPAEEPAAESSEKTETPKEEK